MLWTLSNVDYQEGNWWNNGFLWLHSHSHIKMICSWKTLLVISKKRTSYLEFLLFSSDNGTNLCKVIKCWAEAWIPSKNMMAKYPKCCHWPSKLSINIICFGKCGNNIDHYSINTIFSCPIIRTQPNNFSYLPQLNHHKPAPVYQYHLQTLTNGGKQSLKFI